MAEQIKKAGLEKIAMKKVEDRYALESDKDLEPLKAVFEKSFRLDGTDVRGLSAGRNRNLRAPDIEADRAEGSTYLVWRSEDQKKREPNSLDEVRPIVEAAWRQKRAMKLAHDRALEIEKELKDRQDKTNPEDLVKDLRDQKVGDKKSARVFELDGVARLIRPREAVPASGRGYVTYKPPKDKIEYPSADFVDQIVTTLNSSESMVLNDQPQAHFYVTVATARQVPAIGSLLDVYAQTPNHDPLWKEAAMPSSEQLYLQRAMRELRIAAAGEAKVDEVGRIKIPDDPKIPKHSKAAHRFERLRPFFRFIVSDSSG